MYKYREPHSRALNQWWWWLRVSTPGSWVLFSYLVNPFLYSVTYRMEDKFEIIDEISSQYRRFNADGTQLKLRLLPPPSPTSDNDEIITNPVTHFETDFALRNVAECHGGHGYSS
jgi:hypothetical protein